jgi:nucleoside-triphosphatase THEP1
MRRRMSDLRIQLTRILITGGPCAGKTTALASIAGELTQLGYKVLIVPEAATLISKGGAMIASNAFSSEQGFLFQKNLMKLQIGLENVYCDIGNMVQDTNVVVLIDRGLLDGSAYVEPETWQAILDDLGVSEL